MPKYLALTGALSLALAQTTLLPAQERVLHAGEYPQTDIQYGATVYAAQCTTCHGPEGTSIAGVELKSGNFRNATTDEDLRRIVTIGIPGTSMPGRQLDTAQLTGIIAFLRNMRDFNASAVTLGDANRGKELFEGKGRCIICHAVNGIGSHAGPDLSDIGAARAASGIQQALADPSSVMWPINRPIRIVTRDGKTINGRRLNEDTYTVQLIDEQDRLLSLFKTDFREYTILKKSTMPSYKSTLNDQEMSDVVAYLVSLKGK